MVGVLSVMVSRSIHSPVIFHVYTEDGLHKNICTFACLCAFFCSCCKAKREIIDFVSPLFSSLDLSSKIFFLSFLEYLFNEDALCVH